MTEKLRVYFVKSPTISCYSKSADTVHIPYRIYQSGVNSKSRRWF